MYLLDLHCLVENHGTILGLENACSLLVVLSISISISIVVVIAVLSVISVVIVVIVVAIHVIGLVVEAFPLW